MSRDHHEYSLTNAMGNITRNLALAFRLADHGRAYDHLLEDAQEDLERVVKDLRYIYDDECEAQENREWQSEEDRKSCSYLHQQIDDLKKQLFERQ